MWCENGKRNICLQVFFFFLKKKEKEKERKERKKRAAVCNLMCDEERRTMNYVKIIWNCDHRMRIHSEDMWRIIDLDISHQICNSKAIKLFHERHHFYRILTSRKYRRITIAYSLRALQSFHQCPHSHTIECLSSFLLKLLCFVGIPCTDLPSHQCPHSSRAVSPRLNQSLTHLDDVSKKLSSRSDVVSVCKHLGIEIRWVRYSRVFDAEHILAHDDWLRRKFKGGLPITLHIANTREQDDEQTPKRSEITVFTSTCHAGTHNNLPSIRRCSWSAVPPPYYQAQEITKVAEAYAHLQKASVATVPRQFLLLYNCTLKKPHL